MSDWRKEPLPTIVDWLEDVREEKAKLKKQLDELHAEEMEYVNHLIDNLSVSEAAGVTGKNKTASVITKDCFSIGDLHALEEFADTPGNEDLLTYKPALNVEAVRLRAEDGVTVPGVTRFVAKSLSMVKARRSRRK